MEAELSEIELTDIKVVELMQHRMRHHQLAPLPTPVPFNEWKNWDAYNPCVLEWELFPEPEIDPTWLDWDAFHEEVLTWELFSIDLEPHNEVLRSRIDQSLTESTPEDSDDLQQTEDTQTNQLQHTYTTEERSPRDQESSHRSLKSSRERDLTDSIQHKPRKSPREQKSPRGELHKSQRSSREDLIQDNSPKSPKSPRGESAHRSHRSSREDLTQDNSPKPQKSPRGEGSHRSRRSSREDSDNSPKPQKSPRGDSSHRSQRSSRPPKSIQPQRMQSIEEYEITQVSSKPAEAVFRKRNSKSQLTVEEQFRDSSVIANAVSMALERDKKNQLTSFKISEKQAPSRSRSGALLNLVVKSDSESSQTPNITLMTATVTTSPPLPLTTSTTSTSTTTSTTSTSTTTSTTSTSTNTTTPTADYSPPPSPPLSPSQSNNRRGPIAKVSLSLSQPTKSNMKKKRPLSESTKCKELEKTDPGHISPVSPRKFTFLSRSPSKSRPTSPITSSVECTKDLVLDCTSNG
eukprot:TRINITY_DN3675_c0_g1_i1.p1 TRINITY_DN3675_c0_g1~~TRINITY_DN3675_c0_g1_i1.p1  ORF type:complete len:518 (-),score=71.62 TRINITY_DN3675_c0_g1_i1:2-1555(-)